MTKNDFNNFVRLIRQTYPMRQFLPTKEQYDIWWEYVEPLRKDFFDIAVRNYITTQVYPPMIADITTGYREVEEKQKARMRNLKEIFDFCHSCYPTNLWGTDDWEVFKEAIRSEKYADAEFKAKMIKDRILSDRITGETPFAEYIKGVRL